MRFWCILCLGLACTSKYVDAVCERSPRILGAEDICWTSKIKIADRIQYTTKSVFNFAKEKLGLDTEKEETYHPQQCDYYECIFSELKMLNGNGFPNYDKIVEWIDNNIIYNYAKAQYDRLKQCNEALNKSKESNTYFSGSFTSTLAGQDVSDMDLQQLQDKCEILKEFMKCLSITGTDCIIFKYP